MERKREEWHVVNPAGRRAFVGAATTSSHAMPEERGWAAAPDHACHRAIRGAGLLPPGEKPPRPHQNQRAATPGRTHRQASDNGVAS
ncbi:MULTISPECIES: hypothetical protein [unclassified Streptomyces]|uniref:hypothetical protein n=1 Tax=unclassified Streptomyces TaxID=2593676 RepID=UPI00225B0C0F|nr:MULTISPECIES: hypothetical protein [unclassified Streptomyces]MCX5052361.1 hypothetical protein [Streptomyces sp. NBC_00474]